MEVGESIEIYSERASTMSGSWTDRIYLAEIDDGHFELSNCGPEGLQDASDFMDEDGNYDLPAQIDGTDVGGVEDGYVVGDHYIEDDRYGTVQFSSSEDPAILEWFEHAVSLGSSWDTDQILAAIRKHLTHI
jgi:hypothetical protein